MSQSTDDLIENGPIAYVSYRYLTENDLTIIRAQRDGALRFQICRDIFAIPDSGSMQAAIRSWSSETLSTRFIDCMLFLRNLGAHMVMFVAEGGAIHGVPFDGEFSAAIRYRPPREPLRFEVVGNILTEWPEPPAPDTNNENYTPSYWIAVLPVSATGNLGVRRFLNRRNNGYDLSARGLEPGELLEIAHDASLGTTLRKVRSRIYTIVLSLDPRTHDRSVKRYLTVRHVTIAETIDIRRGRIPLNLPTESLQQESRNRREIDI